MERKTKYVESFENHIKSILNNKVRDKKKLLRKQVETLKKFDKECRAGLVGKKQNSMKASSRAISLSYLRSFGLYIKKPYENVTKEDLTDFFSHLIDENKSPATMNLSKILIKKFYRWLGKDDLVEGIKVTNHYEYKQPEDMLKPQDIKAMIDKADNIRDQLIVAMLFETSARVGELCNIDIEDLEQTEDGYKVKLVGKTGKRYVGIFDSVPFLKEWLNQHPDKDNKSAPLFINFSNHSYGQRLSEAMVRDIVKKLGKRAEISKHVYPHLVRHSSLTHYGKFLTEQLLKVHAGWTNRSNMAHVYCHPTSDDSINAIKEGKGLTKRQEDKTKTELEPKVCEWCGVENRTSNKVCDECGKLLDRKETLKMVRLRDSHDRLLNLLLQDKEIIARIREKRDEPEIQKEVNNLIQIMR